MATKFTIIRHGETGWNAEKRFQGHKNSPLTETGIENTHITGKALRDHKFDVFVSSDLGRTIQTSEIISQHIGMEVTETSDRIRERNYGILQGLSHDEIAVKYPEIYGELKNMKFNFAIPEGETFEQFYNRVSGYMKHLAEKYKDKHILLVSHGGALNCIFRMVMQLPLEAKRNFSILNNSINIVEHQGDGDFWTMVSWGVAAYQYASI